MLVDTPGIGESKTLVKHVSRYLEKSFGFIYVVNSSNAGGVHEGRLKDFLRTVISNAEEELYHDSTLFICNKWETVPDKYKEEVQIDTMRKLQKFFSNITEDQLFFMSVGEIPFPNPEKVHLLIESCAEHGQMQQRREREVDYGHQIANADNSV